MIFHLPDKSGNRLKSCLKRADQFARKGVIEKTHKLYVPFSNMQWYLAGHQKKLLEYPDYWESLTDYEKLLFCNFHGAEQFLQDLIALDWFAEKIDDYAKENIIKDDPTLHAMLYEWKKACHLQRQKRKRNEINFC